jgi:putative restriction endonuclease
MIHPSDKERQIYWLGKLATLNTARPDSRGIPPHKPIMLLCVMEMIEEGLITDPWVPFGAQIVMRFKNFWPLVQDRRQNNPEIIMPFHALGSERDGIWKTFTEDGTPSKAKSTTRRCLLNSRLYDLLQDPGFRREARQVLIESYFPPMEKVAFYVRLGLKEPESDELTKLREDSAEYKILIRRARDQKFKSIVLNGYYQTCALTGLRLVSEEGCMVHAAHIHQHSVSGNDDPRNGLALTPDAHWLFDAGLWTVVTREDRLFIKVAVDRFQESSPAGPRIASFHGQPLCFHEHSLLRPDPVHFEWHRREHKLNDPPNF